MLEGASGQAPVTLVAPVARVSGASGAPNAGSAPAASGVVPATGREYPPDGYADRDRLAIAP